MGNVSKHFNRQEFSCKCGCEFAATDIELIDVLEDLRIHFNKPVIITSGCRCYFHNKNVGGSTNSQHVKGMAVDVKVSGISTNIVADYLEYKYKNKYGIGRYKNWTHLDVRSSRARWD